MLVKVLAIVLIIAAVQLNEALKCYRCFSTKDWDSCDDVKKTMSCPSGFTICQKAEMSYKGDARSVYSFSKGCSNNCKSDIELCTNITGKKDVKCKIDCCSSDLCNAGSVPLVSGFIMMACALLSALTYVF